MSSHLTERLTSMSLRLPALSLAVALCTASACTTTTEDVDDDDDGSGRASASTSTAVASSSSSSASTSGGGGTLPAGCWIGEASCDPRTNAPCEAGEACDAGLDENGVLTVSCYPPPNTQALGAACDAAQGPYCEGGTTCVQGTCARLCCSAADCDGGLPCTAFDATKGTLGACVEEKTCAGPGGACVENADCCSNDCHFNHCH